MANLDKYSYPGDWKRQPKEDFSLYCTRTVKLIEDLQTKSEQIDPKSPDLRGAILQFQVADGYAYYAVTKMKPLTITLIPWSDAYQIPEAHIRGININDVRAQLDRTRNIKSLFPKGKLNG